MSELKTIDDCDGLKFQHGPSLDFHNNSLWLNQRSNVLEVSNEYDKLIVALDTVLEVYSAGRLLSALLVSEDYSNCKLARIDLKCSISRLRLRGEKVACQCKDTVIIVDFLKGSVVSRYEFDEILHDVQWLCDSLICVDVKYNVHKLKDGEKTPLNFKSSAISSEHNNHMLSCLTEPKCVLIFKLDEDHKYIPFELPPEYGDDSVTEIAGCCLLPNNMGAIGLVLNDQDSLILLVNILNRKVELLHYAFNELFLQVGDEQEFEIYFHWIDHWSTLVAFSNCATQVILISCNDSLTHGSGWKVTAMQEGYCLESTDADCCPRGLAVCTTFKDELYRKNALADTPPLKNPPVFFLPQSGGIISIHYADIWTLNEDGTVTQVLQFESTDTDTSQAPIISKLGVPESTITEFATSKSENYRKIEAIYGEALERYKNSKEKDIGQDEKIRLIEMLANCFYFFEKNLTSIESGENSCFDDPKIKSNLNFGDLFALRQEQDRLLEMIKNTRCPFENFDIAYESSQEITELYNKASQLLLPFNVRFECDDTDLVTLENTVASVSDSLDLLNEKLDEYEHRLELVEASRILATFGEVEHQKYEITHEKTCEAGKKSTIVSLLESIAQTMQSNLAEPFNALSLETEPADIKFNDYSRIKSQLKQESLQDTPKDAKPEVLIPLEELPDINAGLNVTPPLTEELPKESGHLREIETDPAIMLGGVEDSTPKATEVISDPLPSFRAGEGLTSFQRQNYTFGCEPEILTGYNLQGGNSANNISIFSSFAGFNKSFADLAASHSGTFTGMSGFTSGNFMPTGGSLPSLTKKETPNLAGDLWNRSRRTNPLD